MRTIKYIVLHCTATSPSATIPAIQRYWSEKMKWKSPGYHHIIPSNSPAVRLASDESICNGVRGYNSESIHISYIGGVDSAGNPRDTRTPNQISEMVRLLKHYKSKFPNAIIQGHRDFPDVSKACPSFNVKEWLKTVNI